MLYGCPAWVGSAGAQECEGHQGDTGCNGPAGEEAAVEEEAVEAPVGREKVGGQGHHNVVAHSGVVWVDAQSENFSCCKRGVSAKEVFEDGEVCHGSVDYLCEAVVGELGYDKVLTPELLLGQAMTLVHLLLDVTHSAVHGEGHNITLEIRM